MSNLLHVHLPGAYRFCNYRCSYCYLPAFLPAIAPETVAALLRVTASLDVLARPLHVIFATDGEISVAKPLWPVLRQVTDLPSTRLISLFTNCSGSMDSVLAHTDPARLSIIATCHLEQLTSDLAVVNFIAVVERLRAQVRSIITSVMLGPDQLPRFAAFKQAMDKRDLMVFAYPPFVVRGHPRPCEPPELLQVRRILAETNPAPILNEFIQGGTRPGLKCAAGREYVEISNDGTVVDCWRHRAVLGNLFAPESLRLRTADTVCPSGGCGSNWPVGFSDVVRQEFRRVDSLYNFVRRDSSAPEAEAFEVS
jgi:hypothetical protein